MAIKEQSYRRFKGRLPFMKILISGDIGFIGFHLSRALLDSGHSVVGIDNHNDYYDVSL